MNHHWAPALVGSLRGYTWRAFFADLTAGVTVGLAALPLAMAFAISSGVPPQTGLYCAVVAGFLISGLGGSRTQIGGPTGAFVVVVSGIVARHGVDGLVLCTLMAGGLLGSYSGSWSVSVRPPRTLPRDWAPKASGAKGARRRSTTPSSTTSAAIRKLVG
jgi:hypothetical protein